jgi:ATP-dependent DNA helicase RecG
LYPGAEAVVEADIHDVQVAQRKRRSLLVEIFDGTGFLTLRFFHFNSAQQRGLMSGARLRCFGAIRSGPSSLEMVHPEYQVISDNNPFQEQEYLTPIYPTTDGLHQISWRNLTQQALSWLTAKNLLTDWIPHNYLGTDLHISLQESLCYTHRPPPDADIALLEAGLHPAQRRLAFEELLAQQLSLVRLRLRIAQRPAPALNIRGTLLREFKNQLPFPLTGAQQRVIEEIARDLAKPHPMLRLVQGDVGSGKTVVAAAACLYAVASGYQAAVMAPTELLAEQHYRSFADWLEPMGLTVAWLSGQQKTTERQTMIETIESGRAAVAIGTHALFQETVAFKDLALAVVDEQHRFGVHQRLALKEKGFKAGRYPHQLIMTATPIPRTLAMTAYADLDYSAIDELPPGRTPVHTVALPDTRRDDVITRVSKACEQGRQAYWVCTLVEESEALQCQAAEATAESLTTALPHLAIGLVHGRMRAQEKEAVMKRFKQGEIHLLVATTVVEVGVDVPNASLMIIENAERLGLAQLHQLRGRVGRGNIASSCVLMFHAPLSNNAKQRLQALRQTTDGFEIAKVDLKLRGPGEVLGTRQTGMLQLRIADIVRDQDLLPQVRETAQKLMRHEPQSVEPLIQRWLGDSLRYGDV